MGRPRILTPEQETLVVASYLNGLSGYTLADRYDVSPWVIYATLDRHSTPHRGYKTYSENSDFFANIKSEKPAYWLGFIAADGSVGVRKYISTLTLTIQLSDRQHLVKFKNDIESDRPIRLEKELNRASITVIDRKIVSDLANYEIVPRKTYTLRSIPLSDENLVRHYIRGIFDGDGSILWLDGNLHLEIAGRYPLLKEIQEVLVRKCFLHYTKISKTTASDCTYRLRYGGNHQVPRILRYLYHNATVYLTRKAEYYFNWPGSQATFNPDLFQNPTNIAAAGGSA